MNTYGKSEPTAAVHNQSLSKHIE
jgi:hypothetical protein